MTESRTPGLSISKVADILGKSPKTILRWMQRGTLKAHKEEIAGHEEWRMDGIDAVQATVRDNVQVDVLLHEKDAEIARLLAEMDLMKSQIEAKDRQISELQILLTRHQKALPEPRKTPWWQFWRR
jgi:IS30 family transposase